MAPPRSPPLPEAAAYDAYIQRVRRAELPALHGPALTDGTSTAGLYLDAGGMPPTPLSGVRATTDDLASHFYANPHSLSAAGVRAATMVEHVRRDVLAQLFSVPEEEQGASAGWQLVFTSGATASLQLAGQSYAFPAAPSTPESSSSSSSSSSSTPAVQPSEDASVPPPPSHGLLAHLLEAHTSVVGLRRIAQARGIPAEALTEEEMTQRTWASPETLVVLPLQCNATGRKYDGLLQKVCSAPVRPRILADAAAYLSSNRMPLPPSSLPEQYDRAPDFIAFSFYKIFGAPTGLGGLVVKSSSAHLLRNKMYYGGGTVSVILPGSGFLAPRSSSLAAHFEDGTLNIQGIVALRHAMSATSRILGSWDAQLHHLRFLARKLHTSLVRLRHANGRAVVQVLSSSQDAAYWSSHPDPEASGSTKLKHDQAPTAAFLLLTSSGSRVPVAEFARLTALANVHVRVGRHCNAGVAVSHTLRRRSNKHDTPITKAEVYETERLLYTIFEQGTGCDTAAQVALQAPESCPLSRSPLYAAANAGSNSINGRSKPLPAALEPDEDDPAASVRVSLCTWNTASDVDELINFINLYFVDHTDPATSRQPDKNEAGMGDIPLAAPVAIPKEQLALKMATLYPIKSCAGQELPIAGSPTGIDWPLTRSGLLHDREWCLIDLETGRAISQKKEPRMATIRPYVDRHKKILQIRLPKKHFAIGGDNTPIPYSTPVGPDPPRNEEDDQILSIPFGKPDLDEQSLRVCADDVVAQVYDDIPGVTDMFSRFLGRKVTLARLPPDQGHRHTKLNLSRDSSSTHHRLDSLDGPLTTPAPILLANESPFLVLHQTAVEAVAQWIQRDLAAKGEEPLSNLHWRNVARRFRANFVIGPVASKVPCALDLLPQGGEPNASPTSKVEASAAHDARSDTVCTDQLEDHDSDAHRSKRLKIDSESKSSSEGIVTRSSTPTQLLGSSPNSTSTHVGATEAACPAGQAEVGAWCPLPGDELQRIVVGGETLVSLGPCRRCQMVAIDQWTGRRLPQTLLSLSVRRRAANGRVVFGTHMAWLPSTQPRSEDELQLDHRGSIYVGAPVLVQRKSQHAP